MQIPPIVTRRLYRTFAFPNGKPKCLKKSLTAFFLIYPKSDPQYAGAGKNGWECGALAQSAVRLYCDGRVAARKSKKMKARKGFLH